MEDKSRLLTLLMIPIMFLIAVSCKDCNIETMLNEADAVIDTCPDSAVAILSEIDTERLGGEADVARYNLLKTLASFKTDELLLNDSVVQPIYDYFMKYDYPARERILVQFLLGHNYLKKSPREALLQFERVEKESISLGNGDYAALGAINCGMVLSNANDDEGAKKKYLRALHLVDSLRGEARFAVMARENLAELYSADNDYTGAISQIDTACMIAERANLKGGLASLYEKRGVVNVCRMRYDAALRDFSMADSISGVLEVRSRCLQALSAYATGSEDADSMIADVRQIEASETFDQLCITTMELNLAYIDKDVERICELEKREEELQRELDKEEQSLLSRQSSNSIKEDREGTSGWTWIIVGITAILSLITIFISFVRKRFYRNNVSENDTSDNCEENPSSIKEELEELKNRLDSGKNGIASALIDEFNLTEEELYIVFARLIGKRNIDIAAKLGESPNTTSSRYSRLRTRFLRSKGENAALYVRYFRR